MPEKTYRILAILTCVRRVRVVQIASIVVDEVPSPLQAGLPRRRVEDGELLRGAPDVEAMKLDREHRAEQTSVRIELVEPRAPESLHGWVGDLDTAEDTEHDHNERVEQRGNLEYAVNSCHRRQKTLVRTCMLGEIAPMSCPRVTPNSSMNRTGSKIGRAHV